MLLDSRVCGSSKLPSLNVPSRGDRFEPPWNAKWRGPARCEWASAKVGGWWAVAESRRCTMEPVGILLATFRHASSTILRKIGLSSLAAGGHELTPYFDQAYGCQMLQWQRDGSYRRRLVASLRSRRTYF
jgi:hypothetical protein